MVAGDHQCKIKREIKTQLQVEAFTKRLLVQPHLSKIGDIGSIIIIVGFDVRVKFSLKEKITLRSH